MRKANQGKKREKEQERKEAKQRKQGNKTLLSNVNKKMVFEKN